MSSNVMFSETGPFYYKPESDDPEEYHGSLLDPKQEKNNQQSPGEHDGASFLKSPSASEIKFWPASSQIGLNGTSLHQQGSTNYSQTQFAPFGSSSIGGPPSSILSESETLTSTAFFDDESIPGHGSANHIGNLQYPSHNLNATTSYMAHARQQSAAAKRWLNEANIHIDPYLRPGPVGLSGRLHKAPYQARFQPFNKALSNNPFTREPLMEELLPRTEKFEDLHSISPQKKDVIWSSIFIFLSILWLLIALPIAYLHPSVGNGGGLIRAGTPLYKVIYASKNIFFSTIGIAGILGAVWTYLLRIHTQNVVYATIGAIPVSMVVAGLAFLSEFKHGHGILLGLCGITLLLGAGAFVWLLWINRSSFATTITITKTSATLLSDNPGIYIISVGLAVSFLVFIGIWLGLFVSLLQVHNSWIRSALIAFYIFMLAWTGAIFTSIQKCMIGGVVCKWYFYRQDPSYLMQQSSPTLSSLKVAISSIFGQVCLAALILAMVRIVRLNLRLYHQITERIHVDWLRSALQSMSLVVGFLEKLLEHVTDFGLYYVSLTGDSFCSSGRSVYKIFRRNLLVGLTTDLVSQLIFTLSSIVIASISGLVSYGISTHALHLDFAGIASILYGIFTWSLLQFFAGIFSDTMDATFMCFAIDLDTEKVHCAAVHQAFSSRLATLRAV